VEIYPQRLASDFLILDAQGNRFAGDGKSLQNFFFTERKSSRPPTAGRRRPRTVFHTRTAGSSAEGKQILRLRIWAQPRNHTPCGTGILRHMPLMPGTITVSPGQSPARLRIAAVEIRKHQRAAYPFSPSENTKRFYSSLGLPVSFKSLDIPDLKLRNVDRARFRMLRMERRVYCPRNVGGNRKMKTSPFYAI
jgi:hypothetical protein